VTGLGLPPPHVLRTASGDVLVLALVGEFDLASTDVLRSAFLEALHDCDRVVVDLGQTAFLDSTALGSILAASRRADETPGGWLRLADPSRHIRRILSVTGIDEALGLYGSVEEARTCAVKGEPPRTAGPAVNG